MQQYIAALKYKIALLEAETKKQKEDIEFLSYDDGFGVLTSRGGALALRDKTGILSTKCDVGFFDLDKLHAVNEIGYDRVGQLVYNAIKAHRLEDIVVSLKFSGDEFWYATPIGTGVGFTQRLLKAMVEQYLSEQERGIILAASGGITDHLSATCAVMSNVTDIHKAIRICQDIVQIAKRKNMRRCIIVV